ncbi:MAG: 4-(cytidine 5'-diphospho)-2-C-methyl-D-erythritol kinase, partial [bacterium]|nr:4-(cytidine 5'-diphospho)-2-C-methyl-D-erythritol kinase [bacterium]
PARRIAPVIADVLDLLDGQAGARLARMSGSGATCFALFDRQADCAAAAAVVRAERPLWWVMETRIGMA